MIHYFLTALVLPPDVPVASVASANRGLACVEESVAPADMRLALALGARDGKDPTAAEAAAQERFQKANAACVARHGLSQAQDQSVIFYAVGGAAIAGSREKLRGYGIDPAMLDRIAAELTPAQRTAALAGDGAPVTKIFLKMLGDSAFKMKKNTEQEWTKLGFVVGEGVAAILMRDKAKADFAAGS